MSRHVVVIGGGVMGSSLAYWLTRLESSTRVTVVERDPSYEHASSALSAASIRQQFSSAVNIGISQASIEFLRNAANELSVGAEKPDIGLRESGYLYLAADAGVAAMRRVHQLQKLCGAPVALLDRSALQHSFPWLNTADLALGSLGLSGEGWFDGYSLLLGFARKARSQGAVYVKAEVNGIRVQSGRATGVAFTDGTHLDCDHVVNAAGAWARYVAALAGLRLPVFGRPRTVYVVSCAHRMQPFPLLIDPSGFWIRPEGKNYIAGFSPAEDPDDAPLNPDYAAFDTVLWPLLAHRMPAFEEARLESAWAGYFEMNTFDHNGILGAHPSVPNFLLMNGFSGHGMQQAPVIGRGIAELIILGRFESIDLSPLLFSRILDDRPLLEANVIG